jgi:hypothetical protein
MSNSSLVFLPNIPEEVAVKCSGAAVELRQINNEQYLKTRNILEEQVDIFATKVHNYSYNYERVYSNI